MEINNIVKGYVLLGIVLVGTFFFALGIQFAQPDTEYVIEYQEKQQPMLLVEFIRWGENIDDSSEVLLDYWVSNYGNIEAKNVVVNCIIQDKDENIINEQSFKIGNVASNSYEWQESIMKYHIKDSDNVYGNCKLESVDGDYINLLERLKELE